MNDILNNIRKQFKYYKDLGEKTFAQVSDDKLFWQPNDSSNSIAIIVNHLNGNMLSRWTDFLNTDGEKDWRQRDEEFNDNIKNKSELLLKWEEGWNCLFSALEPLLEKDLNETVYIRNMGHSVLDAIHRQMNHYAYHIGQIVFIGKLVRNNDWTSLSIPKGKSETYNQEKFSKEKRDQHFTDDL